jgi:hypothetical protein
MRCLEIALKPFVISILDSVPLSSSYKTHTDTDTDTHTDTHTQTLVLCRQSTFFPRFCYRCRNLSRSPQLPYLRLTQWSPETDGNR